MTVDDFLSGCFKYGGILISGIASIVAALDDSGGGEARAAAQVGDSLGAPNSSKPAKSRRIFGLSPLKAIMLMIAIASLIFAVIAQVYQTSQDDALQKSKAEAYARFEGEQHRTRHSIEVVEDFTEEQRSRFQSFIANFAYELPVADPNVSGLMDDLEKIQPTGSNVFNPGIADVNGAVYVIPMNLQKDVLSRLPALMADMNMMSQGVLAVQISRPGQHDPDLQIKSVLTQKSFSFCYIRPAAPAPARLFARWTTQPISSDSWRTNSTITSVSQLTGASCQLVLAVAGGSRTHAFNYFFNLQKLTATLVFSGHPCSLANLIRKPGPAGPGMLVFESTLPDAKSIMAGTAFHGQAWDYDF